VSASSYQYDPNKIHALTYIEKPIPISIHDQDINYNSAEQPVTIAEGDKSLIYHYAADQSRRYANSTDGSNGYERYYFGDFERDNRDGVSRDIKTLVGPQFDLSSVPNPIISFHYHVLGSVNIRFDVPQDNVASWELNIAQLTILDEAAQSNIWESHLLNLSAYSNSTIRVRFRRLLSEVEIYRWESQKLRWRYYDYKITGIIPLREVMTILLNHELEENKFFS